MRTTPRKKNKSREVASLFSGCGGFDLGFVQAGFKCVGAFDIDPLVVDVHTRNLKSPSRVCDLTNGLFNADSLKGIDVLLSGSPCQGFSTAGKRDLDDPRNHLLVAAGHIARRVMPRVFIAENVAAVRSGAHRKYWDSLAGLMRAAGYQTSEFVCDATKLGVPQLRKRAILIAWRTGRDVEVRMPSIEGGTIRSALAGIRNTANHKVRRLPCGSDLELIARRIGCGQKLSNVRGGPRSIHTWQIPEVFGPTSKQERDLLETLMLLRRQNRKRVSGDADPVEIGTLTNIMGPFTNDGLLKLKAKGYIRISEKLCDLVHTFNGKFRRLHPDSPSPTVDTRFGDPRYFLHPTSNRGLTVREAARIQSFPDTFIFDGSDRAQYRMVGNAVPPRLAKHLAEFVREALL